MIQPRHKYPVTGPERQGVNLRIVDPGELALRRMNRLTLRIVGVKQEDIPIILAVKERKGDRPFELELVAAKPGCLEDFPPGTFFRRLSRLKFPAKAVPLA